MPVFFDTHAHMDYPDFSGELPKAIERARAAGIVKILSIGTDQESSARAVKIAEQHPDVYAVVGWHPDETVHAPEDIRPALLELARHPKVVAIGETGLDYFRLSKEPARADEVRQIKEKQAKIFAQHMEVAAEAGLNCVVHARAAFDDALVQMQPFVGKTNWVFHCFSENKENMRRLMDLGALVSFTGIITFKNADLVRDSLAAAPEDRFMLETDSPYLAPVPFRGKRCEPAYVREIASMAAQIRGCSLEHLSDVTCATARKFFKKLGT